MGKDEGMTIRDESRNDTDRKNAAISRRQALRGFGILSASWILAEMSRWSHVLGDALAASEGIRSMTVPQRPLGGSASRCPFSVSEAGISSEKAMKKGYGLFTKRSSQG